MSAAGIMEINVQEQHQTNKRTENPHSGDALPNKIRLPQHLRHKTQGTASVLKALGHHSQLLDI